MSGDQGIKKKRSQIFSIVRELIAEGDPRSDNGLASPEQVASGERIPGERVLKVRNFS
jgi:hypothetical protein